MRKRGQRQAYRQTGADGTRQICGWKRETLRERDGARKMGEGRVGQRRHMSSGVTESTNA